jgi:DUF1009 family protein
MKNLNYTGLIAGGGRFPVLVAQEIQKHGNKLFVIGIKEGADSDIEKISEDFIWLSVGQLQKCIDILKEKNIKTLTMVGYVKHANIYSALKMDMRAMKLMGSLINKKADTILEAVVKEFKKDGIDFLPSHIYLKHLLAPKGLLTGKKLNSAENKDVEFGFDIAKSIAGLDIGQTVVVKDRSVLAVESIEGTDECIKRAYSLGGNNAIAIKVAKPNQDFRFDVPVIGLKTIDTLKDNKIRAMAIEAGSTLILDKDEVIKKAKENDVTILAI